MSAKKMHYYQETEDSVSSVSLDFYNILTASHNLARLIAMASQASERARINFLLRVCSDRAAHIERLECERADSQNALADRDEQIRRLAAALADSKEQRQRLERENTALNEQMRDLLAEQAPSPPEIDAEAEECIKGALLFST